MKTNMKMGQRRTTNTGPHYVLFGMMAVQPDSTMCPVCDSVEEYLYTADRDTVGVVLYRWASN